MASIIRNGGLAGGAARSKDLGSGGTKFVETHNHRAFALHLTFIQKCFSLITHTKTMGENLPFTSRDGFCTFRVQ